MNDSILFFRHGCGIKVVKWIAKIAIIAKLQIEIAKKHNFANNKIQFLECRSQSQHNTIGF